MDLVAFLVPKLWPNVRKKNWEIPETSCGTPLLYLEILHNFGTRNARKSVKGSKDSYYSLIA